MFKLTRIVRGSVLKHYPTGSTLYGKTDYAKFKAEVVNNINVLGAGDKFASYVLTGLLEEPKDIDKVIQEAHNKLTVYFKNEKV